MLRLQSVLAKIPKQEPEARSHIHDQEPREITRAHAWYWAAFSTIAQSRGLEWCSWLSGCLPMAAKAIKAIPQRHVQDQFELDNPIFRLLDQLTLIWVTTMIKAYHHTAILFQILNEMM